MKVKIQMEAGTAQDLNMIENMFKTLNKELENSELEFAASFNEDKKPKNEQHSFFDTPTPDLDQDEKEQKTQSKIPLIETEKPKIENTQKTPTQLQQERELIIELAKNYAQENSVKKLKNILDEFGGVKVSELDPKDYEAFLKKLNPDKTQVDKDLLAMTAANFLLQNGDEALKQILKDYGSLTIAEVDPQDYEAVYKRIS
jgi:hypothetical protein